MDGANLALPRAQGLWLWQALSWSIQGRGEAPSNHSLPHTSSLSFREFSLRWQMPLYRSLVLHNKGPCVAPNLPSGRDNVSSTKCCQVSIALTLSEIDRHPTYLQSSIFITGFQNIREHGQGIRILQRLLSVLSHLWKGLMKNLLILPPEKSLLGYDF